MRELLGELMEFMKELRENNNDQAIILSFGSHDPTVNTPSGSFSATVTKYGLTQTSEAVHLYDALFMARAKIEQTHKLNLEKAEQERAKKPPVSPAFKGFEND